MKIPAIKVNTHMVVQSRKAVHSVLHPFGKAAARLVHVAILGVCGRIPIIASKRINQPIQQDHQSSVVKSLDHSEFPLPKRSTSFRFVCSENHSLVAITKALIIHLLSPKRILSPYRINDIWQTSLFLSQKSTKKRIANDTTHFT